jgi:hypothetical protein
MTFTPADGEKAADQLAKLESKQQENAEKLIGLDNHPGLELLENTALTGKTRQGQVDVLDGIATLWDLHERYRTAAERVHALVAQSQPTEADLQEVNDVQAKFDEAYGHIHGVVSAVHRVWTELTPCLDNCDTLLRQSQAVAAEFDWAADQDLATLLSVLADQLDSIRRIALTDPLALWVDGAVADQAGQLIQQCERAHADLQALVQLRQHAQRRLDQVGTTLAEVRQLGQEIAEERRRVNEKILTVPVREPGTQSIDSLTARLAVTVELYQCRHWRRLATELPVLEQSATATLQRARVELIEAGQPLDERAELRGRLGAYRAKAGALGLVEDLRLEQLYQRARDLLWSAPCDLTVAAAAVAEYQQVINATATPEDVA